MPQFQYLFTAHFSDGTEIRQGQDDLSAHTSGRSAFYDVQKRAETVPLASFVLEDIDVPTENYYAVNAQTGEFKVNGAPFNLYDGPPLVNFRIIYLRRHTHTITMGGGPKEHWMVYRLGWQANDRDGKNYKVVIEFG